MDTQEIPILTEVFKAKTVKTQPDVVEVTPEVRQMIANELRPLITQEVIQALKPVLEADITEALSQQLFAALSTHINAETAQISAQLSTDITANVSKDITNHLQQEVITPLQTTLNQSLTHIQEARETFEQSISGQLSDALTQHQSAREAFEQSVTETLNGALAQQQEARTTFEETLNGALAQQQEARATFEEALTEKLQLDHAQYEQSLSAQSQQFLEAAQLALTNQAEVLGDSEIARVTSETEAKVFSIQEEAIAKIKAQIADSESASEDIFKYAVNAYSEQTQTRLFQEVTTQQLKFTQALEAFVVEAQANMQTTLIEQVREHMKTQMHQELTEQKQAAMDVMADFYQAKVTEATESANQLAQSLNKELVQTVSTFANQLSEDTTQHLKQVQESLLTEATERIRLQVEQELRVTADEVRQNFSHALNADLPEIQQLLAAKVQELFTAELPNFEQIVLARAKAEVGQILSGIRLAFPG